MQAIELLIWFINLLSKFGVFEDIEFEFMQIDQRPEFYAGIFTARERQG